MAILKSRIFLIVLAAVLFVALTMVLGDILAWSWTIRLLGVIVVLLACVALLAIGFSRAARGSDAIEQSIKMQAQQQAGSVRPDRQRDVEDLQRELDRAIQMLKKSKLGQGRRGRAALYALPWYVFIGPPGAGKTTAIVNSGLNFPIGTDRVRGVGGTRNCDWYFSDRAILLDTAGRYVTEPDDEAEWLVFLDTLKKHRPDRPMNGVIVGIALPEISESTLEQVEWHADMIRGRIEELIRHLGLRFPIYLVFTKCDLLQGFVEFFGELARGEREQVWGCTLSPEQTDGDAAAVFDDEFELLYGSLLNRRVGRLGHTMKREERQKVYAFPLQFASLKEKLSAFVHRLFQPNPYQETPVFRGFYFTSGTQEGVPIDRVIQSIAAQFDLVPRREDSGDQQLEAKSYFIREMFSDVIIPDQHLARRTSGATRRGRWFQARAAVTGVVLLALFVFVASQAVVRGKMMLDRAQEAASTAALVSWDDQNAGASNLARVDALREEIHHLESSSVLGIGLQPRGRVLPAVRGLYQRRSREFVGRYPLRSIEENLEAAAVARVDSGSSQRLYDDLKAYLLLGHEVERLRTGEAAEDFRHFLVRHLTDVGFESFQTAGAGLGTQESADRVEAMASAFVSAVAAGDVAGFPTDERRVARARQILAQPLNLGGIYAQLRTRGKDRLPTLSLDDLEMPPQYRGVFASGVEIDGLYTRMGWDSFVQEEIRRLSRDPTRENWVLGRGDAQVPDELRNTEQVSARLTEIYFNEYSAAWQGLLRRVRIQPAQSVGEAADLLRKLGSADSPFLYLLALASDQTQFQGRALPTAAGGEIQERAGVAAVTHPVDRRFAWLHRMNPGQAVSGGAEAAPELYQALAGFQKLAGEFESLGNDEDALGFAATVLEQNGGVMETEWRAIQRTARAFDDRTVATSLFEAPVTDAWEVVLRAANRALSNLWQESVSRPYAQELAGRYPFAESDLDANVLEVDEFFNPQTGVLASFVGQRLKPFLTIDQRQAAIWNGRGLQLDGVLAALAQARHIEEGLFGQGGVLRVAFELRPGLPEKSANAPAVSQLYADIHGQRDTYNMGVASWRSFEWPAGAPLASISVSTQSGQLAPVSFGGDWALFRLLDAATVLRKTSSQYEVRWTFEQPGQYTITAMYELKAERATDLFHDSRNFFRFTPPPGVR